MVSFGGIAAYVQEISVVDSIVTDYVQTNSNPYSLSYQTFGDLATNTKLSQNCCIAMAVLGALILYVILTPYFAPSPYNICA
jgi:hypothetical protein